MRIVEVLEKNWKEDTRKEATIFFFISLISSLQSKNFISTYLPFFFAFLGKESSQGKN